MRRILSFTIETTPLNNANGVTEAIPCVVPINSFMVSDQPNLPEGSRVAQATKVSVQVSLEDAATDANLVVSIEKSLDQKEWLSQATTGAGGFGSVRSILVAPFDSTGIGWVRANVTTAAASATRAHVTFILTGTD